MVKKDLTWSATQLHNAISTLGLQTNLIRQPPHIPAPPGILATADNEQWTNWLQTAVTPLHLECLPVQSSYSQLMALIQTAAPAIYRLPNNTHFVVVKKSNPRRITLIAPDQSTHHISPDTLYNHLTQHIAAGYRQHTQQFLRQINIPPNRLTRATEAILAETMAKFHIEGCWILRLSPSANFWQQIRYHHLNRIIGILFSSHILQQLLTALGGWLIIQNVLQGRFNASEFVAWILILLTMIPIQLLTQWYGGVLSLHMGSLFRERLLYGILQLHSEEIRHQGAGQFLERVVESEAAQGLALAGGLQTILAIVEVFVTFTVLTLGIEGLIQPLLFILWLLYTLFLSFRYFLHNRNWIRTYRHTINDLVERMVGHRTRLAQESFQHWHDEEDTLLDHYLQISIQLDQTNTQLQSVIGSGWLILSLLGVIYAFSSQTITPTQLAITLGGIVLAASTFTHLTAGITSISDLVNAWEQFGPLFQAAGRPAQMPAPSVTLPAVQTPSSNNYQLLRMDDLVFRYQENGRAILDNCSLIIHPGDHLLLEGPSGGGKSTLASLLAGLRSPTSGVLLLHGYDQQTIGVQNWQKRMVAAPQFHENHVLTETFSFNLLMGRRWPPTPDDLAEAETICQELGLGELLNRMPSGLEQMVGEGGWQLSHGERSRLYIARALLQQADLIILDESFAALDPENLERALRCVLKRAPTLLVIAHP